MYGADALGAEGTLDNNFRLRKRRACATYGNRAAKWTAANSSETLYFNTMWTWHTDTGLREGQYSKHIYLGETRVVTKQTSKLEASYGQSDEWHHQYYYHPDHLGSAQLITDYEGNEYQRIEYTPYGELWVEKKTEKEEGLRYLPYKFTAKEQDEETGLYYYGARYLDAKYSRWLSADPAVGEYMSGTDTGEGGIYNTVNFSLYHYAGNNPIKYTDPTGAFDWDTNTIESGDTLAKITNEYNEKNGTNYSYDDVAKVNGIDDPNKIYAGDKLDFSSFDGTQQSSNSLQTISTPEIVNNTLMSHSLTTSNQGSFSTAGDVFSDIAMVLNLAQSIALFINPAIAEGLGVAAAACDVAALGFYAADKNIEGMIWASASVACDIIPGAVNSKIAFNKGANRFYAKATGRFIKTAIGYNNALLRQIPGYVVTGVNKTYNAIRK